MREDRALSSKRGAWWRLVAEGLVIVVSILLALWGEAWWADRADRVAELDLLTALHGELLSNRSTVTEQRQVVDVARRRLSSLLQMTPAEVAAIPPDSVMSRVREPLYRSYTMELAVGELNAAVSSGSLRLIRNRELRSSLAAYQAKQGDAAELGLLLNDLNKEARIALARMPGLAAWAAAPQTRYDEGATEVAVSPDALGAIVRDPDLIAVISAKAGFFNPFYYELSALLEEIDEVIARLEEELDPSPTSAP